MAGESSILVRSNAAPRAEPAARGLFVPLLYPTFTQRREFAARTAASSTI